MKKISFISLVFFFIALNGFGQNLYKKKIDFTPAVSVSEAKAIYLKSFNLNDDSALIEIQKNKDRTDNTHIKYQQFYKGIKVEYGTMILHLKNDLVYSINGELYNPSKLNITPNLSSDAALEKAISIIGAETYVWENQASKVSKPVEKPIIFPVISKDSYSLKLAYKFDIHATQPISRGHVYIDAKNGDLLFNQPIIKHFNRFKNTHATLTEKKALLNTSLSFNSVLATGSADTRYSGTQTIETRAEISGMFTLHDDSRNVHTYNAQNSPVDGTYQFSTVDFQDNDNNWTAAEHDNATKDNAALDAHWGAIKVYDFWSSLGRNSYDNSGAQIRSYVHVGTDYINAFWNGSVMSYGDGNDAFGWSPLTGVDVVAHEIAHAVTTWTANLVYARESGGLNEGFSDVFGAAVEFMAKGSGTDLNPNAEIWLIGEDIAPSPLRSMSNPKSKGDPDTYNGDNYIDATSNCIPVYSGPDYNDGCGVHSNSGVLNHWFYILVSGKTGINDAGDNYDVTGIGMLKAQEIAYLTLRDYLTPNSTFIDTRNAAIEVASALYGSNSAERLATQDAFYAVNLGDKFVPYATDLNVVEITDLVDITCGQAVQPKIKIRNSGAANAITSIQINYSIDGQAQTPVDWTGNLALDNEIEIALPSINQSIIKSYILDVEAVLTGDGDASNNNLTRTFRVNRDDPTPEQVNTFENFLVDYWLTYNEDNSSNLWTLGIPNKAKLNAVTSGTRAYVTGTNSDYPNDKKSYLISPCYDLSTISNPKLKFNMAFELEENYDILYVEYSTDLKNWTLLGKKSDPNWYNSDRIFESAEISDDCENCPGEQWTGSNNGFQEYSYDLSSLSSETNINFRFVFHSNSIVTDEGVVIDDFVIEESSLSVEDFGLKNSITVFPNPSNIGSFSILDKRLNSASIINLEVFDVSGKKLIAKKDIFNNNKNVFKLFTPNFSKGLYFLKLKSANGASTKKLIIN
jgi:Zn-dependent metalloprotease